LVSTAIREADFFQDRVGCCGPHERLGIGVAGIEVGLDRVDEVGDAVEDAAAGRLVGQFAEESLQRFNHELEVGVKCR
jgi:hypothetical protein